MFTFAFTHNPPPPAGTVDLISWWQVRRRGRLNFLGWWKGGRRRFWTEGGVVTGWAATLTRAPWVPSAGAKVWKEEDGGGEGVGNRSSRDKHQWEYERLDANHSGSHAIPSQKKPQERAWPCARVFCCSLFSQSSEQNCHRSYQLLNTSPPHSLTRQRFPTYSTTLQTGSRVSSPSGHMLIVQSKTEIMWCFFNAPLELFDVYSGLFNISKRTWNKRALIRVKIAHDMTCHELWQHTFPH